jgi:hypothetical protein
MIIIRTIGVVFFVIAMGFGYLMTPSSTNSVALQRTANSNVGQLNHLYSTPEEKKQARKRRADFLKKKEKQRITDIKSTPKASIITELKEQCFKIKLIGLAKGASGKNSCSCLVKRAEKYSRKHLIYLTHAHGGRLRVYHSSNRRKKHKVLLKALQISPEAAQLAVRRWHKDGQQCVGSRKT